MSDEEILITSIILSKYLADRNINFEEKDFFELAGNKTIEVISEISFRFNIEEKDSFYNDIMSLANNLYSNELDPVIGVENFLKNANYYKLIGSNNTKKRIIDGLKKIKINKYFNQDSIFSFDIVGVPKPNPAIYLKAIEVSKINIQETIIIEDSAVGIQAGVAAGIKVIGLTAGGHWHKERSEQELYDSGASEVVNSYEDMLLLLKKL